MPQFDMYCYSTQVWWTCASFLSFYFILVIFYLPKILIVLKLREKKKLLASSTSTCLYSYLVKNSFTLIK